MTKTQKNLIIIYEPEQVEMVSSYIRANDSDNNIIVSFNAWAQNALEKFGIQVTSLTEYWPAGTEEKIFSQANILAREWYRVPEMRFFVHKGIPLAEAVEVQFNFFLQLVLYYVTAFSAALTKHADVHLVVPSSQKKVFVTAGPFAAYEIATPIKVARFLAHQNAIPLTILGVEPVVHSSVFPPLFIGRWFLMSVYNYLIGLIRPVRPVRLFASELWKNIGSVLRHLEGTELMLMDRAEVRAIPWRELFRNRIRFVHPVEYGGCAARLCAAAAQKQFRTAWPQGRSAVSRLAWIINGTQWWPLVEDAFDFIVTRYGERLVFDTESFEAIFRMERINKVLLRASMGQNHFFIMARVASNLDIPSIELQHAMADADPEIPTARLSAAYLAAHGPAVRQMMSRVFGYAPERIIPIGSPRFDRYCATSELTLNRRASKLRDLALNPLTKTILAAVPPEILTASPQHFTSFEVREFFRTMRDVATGTGAQIIFKFRPKNLMPYHRDYVEELFPSGGAILISQQDMLDVIQLSDLIVCGSSTVFFEAMILHKPILLHPIKSYDLAFKRWYASTALIPKTVEELTMAAATLLSNSNSAHQNTARADTFLKEGYLFDGHAFTRMRRLLREPLSMPPSPDLPSNLFGES